MKHLRIAISALMIIAFDPLTAHAQTKPKLHIMIEEPSDIDLKCGIRKEPIKASATLVLRRNGIDISNETTYPFIYIFFTSLPSSLPSDGVWCSFFLNIDIRAADVGTKRNGFFIKKEFAVLCAHNFISRVPKLDMNKYLSDQTEDLLKKCLAEIDY